MADLTDYDKHVFHSSSELSCIFLGVKVSGNVRTSCLSMLLLLLLLLLLVAVELLPILLMGDVLLLLVFCRNKESPLSRSKN